eukprot:2108371-Rhodomonas_salina.1
MGASSWCGRQEIHTDSAFFERCSLTHLDTLIPTTILCGGHSRASSSPSKSCMLVFLSSAACSVSCICASTTLLATAATCAQDKLLSSASQQPPQLTSDTAGLPGTLFRGGKGVSGLGWGRQRPEDVMQQRYKTGWRFNLKQSTSGDSGRAMPVACHGGASHGAATSPGRAAFTEVASVVTVTTESRAKPCKLNRDRGTPGTGPWHTTT